MKKVLMVLMLSAMLVYSGNVIAKEKSEKKAKTDKTVVAKTKKTEAKVDNFQLVKSEIVDFKVGSQMTPDVKVKEDQENFTLGKGQIMYSFVTVKPFDTDTVILVNLVSGDGNIATKIEELKTASQKITRNINPIAIEKAGKYAIELLDANKKGEDGKPAVIARKPFEVK